MDIVMLQEVSGQSDPSEEQTMALQIQVDDTSAYDPPDVVVTSTGPKSKTSTSSKRPLSPTESPVLVRGNLHKLGKRLKGWHQRYFEIQGSHMYYYKNATKKDFLGEIDLEICYSCEPTSAATFGSPFEIRTAIRSHTFAARTNEEMYQWVRVIQSNMCHSKEQAGKNTAARPPTGKPKRWESIKNPFATRSRPQPREKVNRKKSFADRFKIKRSRSPTPEVQQGRREETSHSKRPLSFTGDEVPKDTLQVLAELEVSHSLPATPLTQKKQVTIETPTSPISLSSEDPLQSPALTLDTSQQSTPSHVSTLDDIENRTASPQSKDSVALPTQKFVLPEILSKKFIWEEVREVLDTSADEQRDKRMSYSELPSEEKTWMDKSSGMEQLRAFLQVCP